MGDSCTIHSKHSHFSMKIAFIFALFVACASATKFQNCRPAENVIEKAVWPKKTGDFAAQFNKIKEQVEQKNKDLYKGYTDAQILNFEELAEKFDKKLVDKWAKVKNIAKANVIKPEPIKPKA